MRKSAVVLLTLALMLCSSIGAFAATTGPNNPNTTVVPTISSGVPHDSWQYNSVLKLYTDGINGGFSDDTFSGGKVFTELDMCKFIHNARAFVAKNSVNDADTATINKLSSYYAVQLKQLGYESQQVQSVSQTTELLGLLDKAYWMPKFSFQAEVDLDSHFSQNPLSNTPDAKSINTAGYPYTFYPDVYLQMQINGRVSDSWYYYSELRWDPYGANPGGSVPYNGGIGSPTYLRQLEAYGNIFGTTTYVGGVPAGGQPNQNYFGQAFGATAYIGRMYDQLPYNDNTGNQGIVIDNHMMGARVALAGNKWSGDVFAGFEDASFSNYSGYGTEANPASAFLTGADVGYNLSADTQLYGGYYQFWQYNNNPATNNPTFNGNAAPLQFIELGLEQAINPMTQLTVYVSGSPNYNISAISPLSPGYKLYTPTWQDQVGALARLAYGGFNPAQKGSYQFYAQASRIGAGAIWGDSQSNAANYDNEVYQPMRVLGAQGYEVGTDWALTQNTDYHLSFSQTFPMNTISGAASEYSAPYNVFKCELNYYF